MELTVGMTGRIDASHAKGYHGGRVRITNTWGNIEVAALEDMGWHKKGQTFYIPREHFVPDIMSNKKAKAFLKE